MFISLYAVRDKVRVEVGRYHEMNVYQAMNAFLTTCHKVGIDINKIVATNTKTCHVLTIHDGSLQGKELRNLLKEVARPHDECGDPPDCYALIEGNNSPVGYVKTDIYYG